ncbi:fungal specific transcription factor domain-containing protein [Aspergillus stella-maris]|uniref:fungal specific transcription factor domain-containing protein n=1 Tax=Aspergillus stella-maris TaxID=1810926 RepID=UPI003CCE3256
MADIGRLADKILTGIYSLYEVTAEEQFLIENRMVECETLLASIASSLPSHLDFLDDEAPVGEDWQEVQRLHLGLLYHTMRMLIHRPVMVFTTFFSSNLDAQAQAPGVIKLQDSIDASIASASSVITLTGAKLFTRQPDTVSDSSLASYLVAACITLLYQVLDPTTAAS